MQLMRISGCRLSWYRDSGEAGDSMIVTAVFSSASARSAATCRSRRGLDVPFQRRSAAVRMVENGARGWSQRQSQLAWRVPRLPLPVKSMWGIRAVLSVDRGGCGDAWALWDYATSRCHSAKNRRLLE